MSVFCRVETQWRTGLIGATGLDYNVVLRLLDDEDLTREERRELLDDIKVLEVQALQTMRDLKP